MLEITSVKDGLVIDHIEVGFGIKIFNYLKLDKADYRVALIMNAESSQIGRKDLIKIENTYINKEVDIRKIFEKEYTTKVGNTGLGLWKIKDILSKDDNFDLFTTKDDYMFKQQLEIYR